MHGAEIFARSLSTAATGSSTGKPYAHGRAWQYHPRSDRHSKIACWGVLFDLLLSCRPLREHVKAGRIVFGINHEMRDFARNRKKNLDLVLCRSTQQPVGKTFASLVTDFDFELTSEEHAELASLPELRLAAPTSVVFALEAKACMTEHSKARPRIYDELNSSHLTIHGDTDDAIAAGLAVVNSADTFVSPLRNPWPAGSALQDVVTRHRQPAAAKALIEKLTELPRRSRLGEAGYDAFGIVVTNCENSGAPCRLKPQAEWLGHQAAMFEYSQFINRISQIYTARFAAL